MNTRKAKYIATLALSVMFFGITLAVPHPEASESRVPVRVYSAPQLPDSLESPASDSLLSSDFISYDTTVLSTAYIDSLLNAQEGMLATDSTPKRWDVRPERDFLEVTLAGKNQDSLVYNVAEKMVYIYEKGDVNYGDNMNMQADFMRISMDTKEILAYGKGNKDSLQHSATSP
ncbi:MAG: hypothetical protein II217_07550, partial [Alistipes sp.]|nr:hypothetical protein [Alistipes sp.]